MEVSTKAFKREAEPEAVVWRSLLCRNCTQNPILTHMDDHKGCMSGWTRHASFMSFAQFNSIVAIHTMHER